MTDELDALRESVQPVMEAAGRYRQAGTFQSAKPDSTELERAAMRVVAKARASALREEASEHWHGGCDECTERWDRVTAAEALVASLTPSTQEEEQ